MGKMKTKHRSYAGTLFVQGIPETVKRRFKALCVERGITLKDGITKLMEREVNRLEKAG